MTGDFKGKTAVVTGAARGIGRAAGVSLARAGAEVVGFDISADRGEEIDMIAVDVGNEADVAGAVAEAVRRLGPIDILVNSAGVEIAASLASLNVCDLDAMLAVNVRAPILVTRALLPHFAAAARIVNVASELAYLGRAGSSVYCATKGAVLSLTRSWARELAPRILVNAVAPGPTDTPLLNFDSLSAEQKALETANPLGRIAKPEEIAPAILFLAGRGASFITGQCISVDGGAAMH